MANRVADTSAPMSSSRSRHPDNLLLAILFRAVREETDSQYFPADPDRLHTLFSSVIAQCEDTGIREMFRPLETTPYPYVPRLSLSVAHLEHARVLGKLNPDFAVYKFAPRSAGAVLKRLAPELLSDETVGALSQAFWTAVQKSA